MPGEIDVYQPCPCGSGKKVKFCCQAIMPEMIKVAELQATHQFQAALALLDTTEKKAQAREPWSRAWIKTTRAFLLFSLGGVDEPRKLVTEVLEELPDHPLAVGMNAMLTLAVDGYPSARQAVYHAFRISSATQPHMVSFVALVLARTLLAKGHPLAAAQHLLMAVTLDQEHEEAASELGELVTDAAIPYPLRDNYALAPLETGREELKQPFDQALGLASEGRFSDAAKAFGAVARQDPKQSGVWWNIALCHAYAGEDPLAAEALKACAANEPAFESAVDRLVLSRLLRPVPAEQRIPRFSAGFKLESLSKLLSLLDQQPTYVRVDLGDSEDAETPKPAGVYHILDRDPKLVTNDELSADNIARLLGEVVLFDKQSEEQPARAFLSTLGRERLDQLSAGMVGLAGSLAEADGQPREHDYVRKEHFPLVLDWYFPPGLPAFRRGELMRECCRRLIEETWPDVPQEALGGKTPRHAAQVSELKLPLAAAVLELDVFCEKNGLVFDQAAVRERLGLPAVELTPAKEGVTRIDLLHLRHVALDTVADDFLVMAANHVLRLGHGPLSQALLQEALSRPSLSGKIEASKLYMALARISERRLDLQGALTWLMRAKEEAKARKQPLDELAVFEIQEIILRSQGPGDSQLPALAAHLWNYYIPKLPEMREGVIGLFNRLSIAGPWTSAELAAAALATAGVGSSGLWTPQGATEQAEQPSKLWLPGQE